MFDDQLRVVDVVWRQKPRSMCDSVMYFVNLVVDVRAGDEEMISVNLVEIPLKVHHILFSIHRPCCNTSFEKVLLRRATSCFDD